ncbi:aldehyde dehydrogenase [Ensifer sp. ENS11]|uniref:aldehyde dehydrogenase family protein n=1 Tax=Ensifer sp. ENS11 TaxID=2769291 RepID=UPI00177BDCB8|nr:aldehyde dehydrogenase family protein [Ensifer sp. ENS11]MBD9489448.1 aldehyde dehydrogenase family protein [Ensifer sp. ENS11]
MARHVLSSTTLKRLEQPAPFWIDGKPVRSGRTVSLCNPATGQSFAECHVSTGHDVDQAVAAARAAFVNPDWAGMNAAVRARILWRLAELIDAHAIELAELETLCMGKPIAAAMRMEVPFFAETFRYFAGWCTKISGMSAPLSFPAGDLHGLTLQEPVGVVGMILPWNGPLVIAGWKIAPALATGCTCVIKPAETTPLSLLRFAELAAQAGVPDGVINIVTGSGSEVGSAISRHPGVDKLAFTGSTGTGRALLQDAAASNLKKLSLELGGKSPVLVFDDADLDAAVDGAVDAIFGNSGQVCVAGSRLYLQKSIRDDFVARLTEKANALRIGDPMDEKTQLGPIASQAHLDAIHRRVEEGVAGGAVLLCGGRQADSPGSYYPPTILDVADQSNGLVQDEIFGPVLCVATFESEEEAIALANGTRYGLAASVWTSQIDRAFRVSRAVQCGVFWVNTHNIPDLGTPIGGYGQSGWGRELGHLGLSEYLQSKSVMFKISPAPMSAGRLQ